MSNNTLELKRLYMEQLYRADHLQERVMQEQPHYMLDEDLDAMDSNIGIVQFTPEDVVRSGLTRAFVKMYHHN